MAFGQKRDERTNAAAHGRYGSSSSRLISSELATRIRRAASFSLRSSKRLPLVRFLSCSLELFLEESGGVEGFSCHSSLLSRNADSIVGVSQRRSLGAAPPK